MAPAQLEEDGPPELVAVLPPPGRDQVDECKAPACLGELIETPDGRHVLGAVVAHLDPHGFVHRSGR